MFINLFSIKLLFTPSTLVVNVIVGAKIGEGFITEISSSVNPSIPHVLAVSILNNLGGLLSPEKAIKSPSPVSFGIISTLRTRSPALKFNKVPVVDCATITEALVSMSYSMT